MTVEDVGLNAKYLDEERELLRAIAQGRVDHQLVKRADEMFRFCVILMRRLGGDVTLTIDELMSKTDDVEIVHEAGGIRDPLAGNRIRLGPARPRTQFTASASRNVQVIDSSVDNVSKSGQVCAVEGCDFPPHGDERLHGKRLS